MRPVVPRFVLRGVSGEGFGRSHPLLGPTVVGRAPECNLRLDANGLSRQHARLVLTGGGVQVEDLGSTNGTFINGKRVQRGIAVAGDEIGFDQLRFRLTVPGKQEPTSRETGDERQAPRADFAVVVGRDGRGGPGGDRGRDAASLTGNVAPKRKPASSGLGALRRVLVSSVRSQSRRGGTPASSTDRSRAHAW